MAKKKRPSGPPTRPGARPSGGPATRPTPTEGAGTRSTDGAAATAAATGEGTTVAGLSAEAADGGPNRAARKEAARREREALQRKMGRRRTTRIVAIITAVAVVAAGITFYVVTRKPARVDTSTCGPVKVIPPFSPVGRDHEHITSEATAPPLTAYRSIPPASGPHNAAPLNAGIYSSPPDFYMALHSLEHAAVEIWLEPSASGSERQAIESFYGSGSEADHVIVAPYQYPGPAGHLPAGVQMALVAWHHVQYCDHLSLAAVKEFVASYRVTTGSTATAAYKGDASEIGVAI